MRRTRIDGTLSTTWLARVAGRDSMSCAVMKVPAPAARFLARHSLLEAGERGRLAAALVTSTPSSRCVLGNKDNEKLVSPPGSDEIRDGMNPKRRTSNTRRLR